MIKSKFALLFDSFFLTLLLDILLFIWLRKLFKNANLFYFFLIILTILLFGLIFKILFKSNNKKVFKSNNEKFLKNCLNYLTICPLETYKTFICKLLNCSHIENYLFKLKDNFIFINLKTETSASDYFLTQELILKQSNTNSKLYFIYKIKSKSFDDIIELSKFDIKLFDSNIILRLMETKNIYPLEKSTIKKESFKCRINKFLKQKTQGITHKHFKEFFFSGLSLLFLSLIVPFSNLYLISGTILLTISIITLFKKNYVKKNSESDFLFK